MVNNGDRISTGGDAEVPDGGNAWHEAVSNLCQILSSKLHLVQSFEQPRFAYASLGCVQVFGVVLDDVANHALQF
jgi:hypothetical protein